MSAFKALNVESDSESDISIDDTKEIQIEDALKLYQNAIQAHAKAVETRNVADFEDATKVYDQLFASDIFQWPESQIELRRRDSYSASITDENLSHVAAHATTTFNQPTVAVGDAGPSTLPQILHLSHKNFAHFKLEALSAKLETLDSPLQLIVVDASVALEHFVSALDKDEGDLDLWRRSSAVGEILDSFRLARFCLEAAIDGDDDAFSGMLALPSLDDVLANARLREVISTLQDSLSLLQAPPNKSSRSQLPKAIKQRLSPYRDLISQSQRFGILGRSRRTPANLPGEVMLRTPESWAELGDILSTQRKTEETGSHIMAAGSALHFNLVERNMGVDPNADNSPPRHKAVDQNRHFDPPTTIEDLFPGLMSWGITVQPQIAYADPSMADFSSHELPLRSTKSNTSNPALMTRKRSAEAAALHEKAEDEGRTKSRRVRNRESTADNESNRLALIEANMKWEFEQQLNECQAADDWMFDTAGSLFERIGVLGFNKAKYVRQGLETTDMNASMDGTDSSRGLALQGYCSDLKHFLTAFDDNIAQLLLTPADTPEWSQRPPSPGPTNSFSASEIPNASRPSALILDDGLYDFLKHVNQSWLPTEALTYKWIEALLNPDCEYGRISYEHCLWPGTLKTVLFKTLVDFDVTIYQTIKSTMENLMSVDERKTSGVLLMIQALFEIHLDIYCSCKARDNITSSENTIEQGTRLLRWSELAYEAISCRSSPSHIDNTMDELDLRYLWAVTLHLGASEETSQHRVVECLQDLRSFFIGTNISAVYLPNNAVMPELSLSALEREIAILTTKDFFDKVTNPAFSDPVSIIESLEPLLDALEVSTLR